MSMRVRIENQLLCLPCQSHVKGMMLLMTAVMMHSDIQEDLHYKPNKLKHSGCQEPKLLWLAWQGHLTGVMSS